MDRNEMDRKRRGVFGYPFQSGFPGYHYVLPIKDESANDNSDDGKSLIVT